MIVYLDGDYLDSRRAISADDRGLLLGCGAFETIYFEDGACAFLDEHLARLRRGLATLDVAADIKSDWRSIARALAAKNGVTGAGALRLTVTGGPGGRGPTATPSPTVLVSLSPLGARPQFHKVSLVQRVRCSASVAARFKLIGGYVDNLAALAEARASGADEAIMLNERGGVACASVANIFLIAPDGAVATPRIDDGALPGVVRGVLLGGDHGVKIDERAIRPEEASEGLIVLTNSLRGVAPCLGGEVSAPAMQALEALRACYASALARELRGG